MKVLALRCRLMTSGVSIITLAVSSSSRGNLEITHSDAQKALPYQLLLIRF